MTRISYKRIIFSLFSLLCTLTILGCGGGGSGSKSTDSTDEITIPSVQVISQKYQGESEPATVTESNLTLTAYELLYWKDFLSLLAIGSDAAPALEHPANIAQNIYSIGNNDCQSGSISNPLPDDVKDLKKYYKVSYNNCRIGSLVANGDVGLHIKGANIQKGEIHSFTIALDEKFRITDDLKNKTYNFLGSIKEELSGTWTANLAVSSEQQSEVLYHDVKFKGNGRYISGTFYLADLGKFDLKVSDDSYIGKNSITVKSNYSHQTKINLITISYQPLMQEAFYGPTSYAGATKNSIIINAEDFNLENLTQDLGPTDVDFYGENVVWRDETVEFDIAHVDSKDFNLFKFNWQIQDENQQVVFEHSEREGEFSIQKPGKYKLTLTTTDSFQNKSQYSENVFVMQTDTTLDVVTNFSVQQKFTDGLFYQAKLDVISDMNNLSLSIAYGPAGLAIDQQGNISWSSVENDISHSEQVNFGILITDNTNGKFSVLDHEIQLPQKQTKVQHLNLTSQHLPTKHNEIINDETHNSLVLGYYKGYYTGYLTLSLVNGVLHRQWLPFTDTSAVNKNSLSNNYIDITNDGNLDSFIVDPYKGMVFTSKETGQINFTGDFRTIDQSHVCDLNQDGYPEVMTVTFGYDQIDVLRIMQWTGSELKIHNMSTDRPDVIQAKLLDHNLDGKCDALLTVERLWKEGSYFIKFKNWKLIGNELVQVENEYLIEGYGSVNKIFPAVDHQELGYQGVLTVLETGSWALVGVNATSDTYLSTDIEVADTIGIHLSPLNSKLFSSFDVDSDGSKEWLFHHQLTDLDPLYNKIGYNDNRAIKHNVIVAAKIIDGRLTPTYLSSITVDKSNSLLNFTVTDDGSNVIDNGRLPIVLNKEGRFVKALSQNSEIKQAYYVLESGAYYQLLDSNLSYFDEDANFKWQIDSFSINTSSTDDWIEFLGSYQGVDFIKIRNKWSAINRSTGVVVTSQQDFSENFEVLMLHPDFTNNGLFFVYPDNYAFGEHANNPSTDETVPFNVPGVYQLSENSVSLKYNWRQDVFALMNIRVESISWVDVDNDGQMEIVSYFTKYPNSELVPFYYSAEMDGSNIQVHRFAGDMDAFEKAQKLNNRCFEPSCRQVVVIQQGELADQNIKKVLVIDKLSGAVLWQLQGQLAQLIPHQSLKIGKNGEIIFNSGDHRRADGIHIYH